MIKIKLFGTLRLKSGFKEMEADISAVREAWPLLAEATGLPAREFKKCIIALNGKPCKRRSFTTARKIYHPIASF